MNVSPSSPQLVNPKSLRPPAAEKPKYSFLPTSHYPFSEPLPPSFNTKRKFEKHVLNPDDTSSPQLPYKRISKTTRCGAILKPPLPTTPEILEAFACKEGTIQYREGTYVGELLELVPHGKGSWRSTTGETYEGHWLNGKRHGYGTYKCHDHFYNGDWENDMKHGQGFIAFRKEGDYYEGAFCQDKRHGYGVYHFYCGAEFKGNFQNDAKEGMFIVRAPSGLESELLFIDNRPKGMAQIRKLKSDQLSLDQFFKTIPNPHDASREVIVID